MSSIAPFAPRHRPLPPSSPACEVNPAPPSGANPNPAGHDARHVDRGGYELNSTNLEFPLNWSDRSAAGDSESAALGHWHKHGYDFENYSADHLLYPAYVSAQGYVDVANELANDFANIPGASYYVSSGGQQVFVAFEGALLVAYLDPDDPNNMVPQTLLVPDDVTADQWLGKQVGKDGGDPAEDITTNPLPHR